MIGCTRDTTVARQAQTAFLGMPEADVQTCLGVPNRRADLGPTSILTYDQATVENGAGVTVPLIGGINFASGGNCRAHVRLDNGVVTQMRYTGETDSPLGGRDAYCAALVRSCVREPLRAPPPPP